MGDENGKKILAEWEKIRNDLSTKLVNKYNENIDIESKLLKDVEKLKSIYGENIYKHDELAAKIHGLKNEILRLKTDDIVIKVIPLYNSVRSVNDLSGNDHINHPIYYPRNEINNANLQILREIVNRERNKVDVDLLKTIINSNSLSPDVITQQIIEHLYTKLNSKYVNNILSKSKLSKLSKLLSNNNTSTTVRNPKQTF